MTVIFQRDVAGPATHAFVVGIGGYPFAKPGKPGDPVLRKVPDIPSAANSAKRMADWLIDNQDTLAAPLASLDVLIGEAPVKAPDVLYDWKGAPDTPVDEPTLANVEAAGVDWVERVTARDGDVAFFYICGHGATLASEPVVFLTDLNADKLDRWGAFINLGQTARAFKQQNVQTAFFFSDACQEFLSKFELSKTRGGARIVEPLDSFRLNEARDKVTLLSGASEGLLGYEGEWSEGASVKMGRFTQTLVQALDGQSVRSKGGRWVVYPGSLIEDLKPLHRLRTDWRSKPFEPSAHITPNDVYPIVAPGSPRVPVLIQTDPGEEIDRFDLGVFNDDPNVFLDSCGRGSIAGRQWVARVPPSYQPHNAVAISSDLTARYQATFFPISPIFDARIMIR
jgi:hypothetical protein